MLSTFWMNQLVSSLIRNQKSIKKIWHECSIEACGWCLFDSVYYVCLHDYEVAETTWTHASIWDAQRLREFVCITELNLRVWNHLRVVWQQATWREKYFRSCFEDDRFNWEVSLDWIEASGIPLEQFKFVYSASFIWNFLWISMNNTYASQPKLHNMLRSSTICKVKYWWILL